MWLWERMVRGRETKREESFCSRSGSVFDSRWKLWQKHLSGNGRATHRQDHQAWAWTHRPASWPLLIQTLDDEQLKRVAYCADRSALRSTWGSLLDVMWLHYNQLLLFYSACIN